MSLFHALQKRKNPRRRHALEIALGQLNFAALSNGQRSVPSTNNHRLEMLLHELPGGFVVELVASGED
jgi:hypothetical protein